MKNLRFLWILIGCLYAQPEMAQEIIFSTTKQPGKTITLSIEATGEVSIQGVNEAYNSQQPQRSYTLKDSKVKIQGNVTKLVATQAEITDISFSHLPQLAYIDCSQNNLIHLDVSSLTGLRTLSCYANQLTQLSLDSNSELEVLKCTNNALNQLQVAHLEKLTELSCSTNNISNLDVTGCPLLKVLKCYNNQLSQLDISHCPFLESLWCSNNALEELDLQSCPQLRAVWCYDNKLTQLEFPLLNDLVWLHCDNNALQNLDVSHAPRLKRLMCYANEIAAPAMSLLVKSLPNRATENTPGLFYCIDTKDEKEKNVCYTTEVSVAESKGWSTLDYQAGANQGLGVEYAGSTPQGLESIFSPTLIRDDNGGLKLYGVPPLQVISIYDLQGVLVMQTLSDSEGCAYVSLPDVQTSPMLLLHIEGIHLAFKVSTL